MRNVLQDSAKIGRHPFGKRRTFEFRGHKGFETWILALDLLILIFNVIGWASLEVPSLDVTSLSVLAALYLISSP
jgi:hypothetical protein